MDLQTIFLAVLLFILFESIKLTFDIFKGITSNYLYDYFKNWNARRTKEKTKLRIRVLVNEMLDIIELYKNREEVILKSQYIILSILTLFTIGLAEAVLGVSVLSSQVFGSSVIGIILLLLSFAFLVVGMAIGVKATSQLGLVAYFDRQVKYRLEVINELLKVLSSIDVQLMHADFDKINRSLDLIEQGREKLPRISYID